MKKRRRYLATFEKTLKPFRANKKLKNIIAICFLIASIGSVQGQTSIGIKQGATFSQVLFSDLDFEFNTRFQQELQVGNLTGIAFKYFNQKHVGLQVELNFTQKGWTQILATGEKFKSTLNYIQMPIMTHIRIGNGKLKPFLIGGLFLSYLNAAKENTVLETETDKVLFHYTIADDQRFEFGLGGGGGLSLSTKIGTFQGSVKFMQGLADIIDEQDTSDPTFSKNQSVEVSFGYFYTISKFVEK